MTLILAPILALAPWLPLEPDPALGLGLIVDLGSILPNCATSA